MLRWSAGLLGALAALVAAAGLLLDSAAGHRFVAAEIGRQRPASGLRFAVGRIDGSLFGAARLSDVRVYDLNGQLAAAPVVRLDWRPWRWLDERLDITALDVPELRVLHAPHTRPSRGGSILPRFDVHLGRLTVGRLVLAPAVLGQARTGRLAARVDIVRQDARVDLNADVAGSDRLRLHLDAAPDRDRFALALSAQGAAGGVLARAATRGRPLALAVNGSGTWTRWRGTARSAVDGRAALALSLAADAGRYRLAGTVAPAPFTHGLALRLTAPRARVAASATLHDRRLAGRLTLTSPSAIGEAVGALDLGSSTYRDLRLRVRALRPSAILANMTAQGLELRAVLDGPMATARFDYRLDAARVAFGSTGLTDAHAAGAGHLSPAPVAVPVRLGAAAVTGVGDVAGGILRRFRIAGVLHATTERVTAQALQFASDKLAGHLDLSVDLSGDRFQLGLGGTLGQFLIPGFGVVDVHSTLAAGPGPGGLRLAGHGTADLTRLDDSFFRSLFGGLAHLDTGLERTPDAAIHFTGLKLTAPLLTLTGSGYRRPDHSVHFDATGTHQIYGPVQLVLDGDIARPTVDVRFPLLDRALGLRDVALHLDPTTDGFAFRAQGRSAVGPFVTGGSILLPVQGQSAIQVAALDVSGARVRGRLGIVPGGFEGTLPVTGGGWSGRVVLRPVGNNQRIEAHLDADAARIDDLATLRRGHLDLDALLDPAGTRLDVAATGAGLTRGSLRLARFTAGAKLVGGTGRATLAISGQRGRAFDIRASADVTPGVVSVSADGTLDRRPIRLLAPARVATAADGWRLEPVGISFAGGTARIGGSFGDNGASIDVSLAALPLAVLDIGYPGLELGGTASGSVAFRAPAAGAPTGRADLTVRGLTRSGLAAVSHPIDLGVAAALTPDRLGVRAVAAAGGKTVGRAQALLTPLGSGDLPARLAAAPLLAQLRFAGPADALWRLTGVELFDLSGPVSIGADVTGSLAHPVLRGAVQAQGARIESATTGTVLTDVAASGRFDGPLLRIERFTAAAGRDGKVTGEGRFDFAAAHGVGLDLALDATRAAMINRDDIGATVTGRLTFRSDGAGGTIGGDVVLNRSRYRLGQATAATAAPQLHVREINLPEGGEADDMPPTPWRLALRARAPNGLLVSGLGLSSEWSADLQLGGAPDDPAIAGRATLIRGDYEFSGREFQLDRGVIRFDGLTPANPALDISANADTTGLSATIRVTGTGLKPEISFTSVPALPEDELLSRLLFGTSITSLSAPEALQLAAAVAALRSGNGGLNPINAIRRVAGLDRLRILPADPQTGQGTSIAAGKYVTRRLYAEIVTDGAGYSATQAEFQVTRWLSILSSISTLGRTSGNVRVSKDY